ncbi:hypothetical protein [Bordetella genomosp. 1]|uniref:hypothetical protein n=1 Tax=Bordetella genomosp. 1 TaxID=1395607 RepID=UPI00117886E4|nr:hypothetical protein [Bordetella genomosp. 1]
MTSQQEAQVTWFRVTPDVKKHGPIFCVLGLIFGVIQVLGYRYFDEAQLGSTLLQEQIAFYSLALMLMFLLPARGLTLWLSPRYPVRRIKALIERVAQQAMVIGSIAASAIIGFAIAAAIFGAYASSVKFVHAGVYFLALAEVAANPVRVSEASKGYSMAMGMLIATPFIY